MKSRIYAAILTIIAALISVAITVPFMIDGMKISFIYWVNTAILLFIIYISTYHRHMEWLKNKEK